MTANNEDKLIERLAAAEGMLVDMSNAINRQRSSHDKLIAFLIDLCERVEDLERSRRGSGEAAPGLRCPHCSGHVTEVSSKREGGDPYYICKECKDNGINAYWESRLALIAAINASE